MEIASLNSTTSLAAVGPQTTTSTNSAGDLNYESFLRLLVAQMKNQDPLNPMEGTEYTAQLAQFSSLEQSIKMNDKLDAVIGSMMLSQAESVIGRTVTSADGSVTGEVESVTLSSHGPVANLKDGGKILLTPGITIS